jgi:hypothetical protein
VKGRKRERGKDAPGQVNVAEGGDVADVEEGDMAEGDRLGEAQRGRNDFELFRRDQGKGQLHFSEATKGRKEEQ